MAAHQMLRKFREAEDLQWATDPKDTVELQLARIAGHICEDRAWKSVALAEIMPSAKTIRLIAVAGNSNGKGTTRIHCLEADEGLREMMNERLDVVVYANTASACSELALLFRRLGCDAAMVVSLGRSPSGGLYILAAGLNGPKNEIARHLQTLLTIVGLRASRT